MTSQLIPNCFGLNFPLNTIQAIRLCAALLETNYDIHFSPEVKPILKHWNQYFPVSFHIGLKDIPILEDVEITHKENPSCRIGNLKTVLLYPHCMVDRCQSLWNEQRTINFSFSGLITAKRKQALENWINSHFEVQNKLFKNIKEHKEGNKISRLYKNLIGSREIFDEETGIYMFASNKGRIFPIKVWDEKYYSILSNSKFVLCPDGEFVWTYRFFEAIFCGAIPIVENSCELYRGYHYFLMSNPLDELIYSTEMTKKNFQKAKAELTLSSTELNTEISRLLSRSIE